MRGSMYKFRKLTNEEIWSVDTDKCKVHGMPCTAEEFPDILKGLTKLFDRPYYVSEDLKVIQYWIVAEDGKNKVYITISYDKTGNYPKVTDNLCFAVYSSEDQYSLVEELIALIYDARPSDD